MCLFYRGFLCTYLRCMLRACDIPLMHESIHARLWFETEEEFFAAASKCGSLYFLPERRIFFPEKSLFESIPGEQPLVEGVDMCNVYI